MKILFEKSTEKSQESNYGSYKLSRNIVKHTHAFSASLSIHDYGGIKKDYNLLEPQNVISYYINNYTHWRMN